MITSDGVMQKYFENILLSDEAESMFKKNTINVAMILISLSRIQLNCGWKHVVWAESHTPLPFSLLCFQQKVFDLLPSQINWFVDINKAFSDE